jgi:hypothetical protein
MEEETPMTQPLFFSAKDWMFSETGYNLIAGILPQYEPEERNYFAWAFAGAADAAAEPEETGTAIWC